jgi:rare lipoprotein A
MSILKLAYLASWLSVFLVYSQGVFASEQSLKRNLAVATVISRNSSIVSYHPQPPIQEKTEKKKMAMTQTVAQDSVATRPKTSDSLCDLLSELDDAPSSRLLSETQPETRLETSSHQTIDRNFRQKILDSWKNLFNRSANAAQIPLSQPIVTLVTISDQTASTSEIITRQNRLQSWFKLSKTSPSALQNKSQEIQILVNNSLVGTVREPQKARIIARRLESLLSDANLDPLQIMPTIADGQPAGKLDQRLLFVLDQTMIPKGMKNPDLLAVEWVNNLRIALNASPLNLVEAQQKMYNLVETDRAIEGLASWYGPYFHGRLTANGEIYNQHGLTAAHPSMKLNTYLKVTNLNNDKSIILRVNDRGPYIPPRSLDLSLGAAECLDGVEKGVIPYRAVVMQSASAN